MPRRLFAFTSSIHVLYSGKSIVLALLLIIVISLSAWSYLSGTIETGAYQFTYPQNFGNRINIPADNPTTKQGVYLGRLLFYESRLSANNKISCGSCHQQEKAFTDGKPFSEGFDKVATPRNAMSLVNLLWARKFFWDGRAEGLEAQAVIPITSEHEMGQSLAISVKKIEADKNYAPLFKLVYGDEQITGERIVKAISQFERTLISCNAKYDQYLAGHYQPTKQELNGMALFMIGPDPERGIRGANCAHCHGGPKTYMELFHNNGLDSLPKDPGIEKLTGVPTDLGRFKVPTLRNIALTAPYMHDGRFKTLNEVVEHYSEHIIETPALSQVFRRESNEVGGKSLKLTADEKRDLIAFLNMLTDETFIHDTRFSDPHKFAAKN